MAEMSLAGKNHSHAMRIGCFDHFAILYRATRLNRCSRTSLSRCDQSVREGEERIAANDASLQREPCFGGFPDGDSARIDATHLTRADPERAIRTGINNSVGLNMFHDPPTEPQCTPLQV